MDDQQSRLDPGDHRVVGRKLDLFHFRDDAPGMPFFQPDGAFVHRQLVEFMRVQLDQRGYGEVRSPALLPSRIWEVSGHADHFAQNMFFAGRGGEDDDAWAVKPMSCPGHILMYAQRPRSYRELPMRMSEMGLVHRREPSGARHGLKRAQVFVQDDAHHFCQRDQVADELDELLAFIVAVYEGFDLPVKLELSLRPDGAAGDDAQWAWAQGQLRGALERSGHRFEASPGEGAFYGPKIDFHVPDGAGRSWQCGTIQLDLVLPRRFGIEYVAAGGSAARPIMIHRAVYGSVERFLGILLERDAGWLPVWLAPRQVAVLPVSARFVEPAEAAASVLRKAGVRAQVDKSDERLGFKVRSAQAQRVHYLGVIGQREAESGSLRVRDRHGEDLGELALADLIQRLPERPLRADGSS